MASVRSMIEKRLEQIESTVEELRDQIDEGEFDQMIQTTDKLGEHADHLAQKLSQVSDSLQDEEDEDGEEDDGKQQQGRRRRSSRKQDSDEAGQEA